MGLDLVLALTGAPIAAASGYLLSLTALSARIAPPRYGACGRRFRIVVPAHNEAAGIAATVRSLLSLDYPRELYDVLVVADNCADDTADRAGAAGAEVLVRNDTERRGKGYALLHAFERLSDEIDAVVVIDADTVVSPNLLQAFAARLELGAEAVQADYAVRNPEASWRTRLVAIAFGSFHVVRSRGRERLKLSAGLRGNGMCFSTKVLREVPHEAFSIVEDVEYGIRLGEAGYRVHYADEAHVYGEMVSSAAAASSQRTRWEGGRARLARAHAGRLLRAAVRRRDRVLADLAVDLLIPPLSRLAVVTGLGLGVTCVSAAFGGGLPLSITIWSFSAISLVLYVARGWAVSGTGARALLDLARAPLYVVWKWTLRRPPKSSEEEWVRTARAGEAQNSVVE
jgi:1,2-diacylglycerol 3-beta-glucosyltransferase